MKEHNNNSKQEFWRSDVFIENELARIWKQYHVEESGGGGGEENNK